MVGTWTSFLCSFPPATPSSLYLGRQHSKRNNYVHALETFLLVNLGSSGANLSGTNWMHGGFFFWNILYTIRGHVRDGGWGLSGASFVEIWGVCQQEKAGPGGSLVFWKIKMQNFCTKLSVSPSNAEDVHIRIVQIRATIWCHPNVKQLLTRSVNVANEWAGLLTNEQAGGLS